MILNIICTNKTSNVYRFGISNNQSKISHKENKKSNIYLLALIITLIIWSILGFITNLATKIGDNLNWWRKITYSIILGPLNFFRHVYIGM